MRFSICIYSDQLRYDVLFKVGWVKYGQSEIRKHTRNFGHAQTQKVF